MSAASSGGVVSSVRITDSTIAAMGCRIAARTSLELIVVRRKRPVLRSRPATSVSTSSGRGQADPHAIFADSAVSGPINRRSLLSR